MRWMDSRCTLVQRGVLSAAFGLTLLAAVGLDAVAQQVAWELWNTVDDPGEQDDKRVACGRYGVFHLEVENALEASIEPLEAVPRTKGVEVPRPYPRDLGTWSAPSPVEPVPAEPVPLVPSGTPSSPWAGRTAGPLTISPAPRPGSPTPLPYDPPWFPCNNAQCFGSPAGFGPGQPWVAVIDWNGPHGWTVGWTIRQIAGPGVKLGLFPLTDEELESIPRRGETDAHVLAQLCALAELVDLHGVAPPVVVNMSFGRLADRPEDLLPADLCDERRITCQIALVMEYLRQRSLTSLAAPGTQFVAAAGNHKKLLYPAAAPGVLAAGSLDLATFWANGVPAKSWETPKLTGQAAALMPGYGICLFPSATPQAQKGHPVPPGTSFATATFSGFLVAPLLAGQVQGSLEPVLWTPIASCTPEACSYRIAHGSQLHAVSSGLALVLEQARTGRPACRPPNEGGNQIEAGFSGQPHTLSTLPTLSFDDIAAEERKQPAPGNNPCVPCSGHSQPPPLLALGFASVTTRSTLSSPLDLVVDMSFAGAIPGDFVLEALYLRVGEEFYFLDVPQLDRLQVGEVDRLLVPNAGGLIAPGVQPSLLLVLLDELETGEPFWTSIPILMR